MKESIKEVLVRTQSELEVFESYVKPVGFSYKFMGSRYSLSSEESLVYPIILRVDLESKNISHTQVPTTTPVYSVGKFILNFVSDNDFVIAVKLSKYL